MRASRFEARHRSRAPSAPPPPRHRSRAPADASQQPVATLGVARSLVTTKVAKRVRKLRRRMERFSQSGQIERARRETWKYLNSAAAQLVAAEAANKKLKGRRKRSPDQVTALVEGLDPWRRSREPVVAYEQQKRGGGTRYVYDYGPADRAVQNLVKTVISANATLHPSQTATAGGRSRAYDMVVEALADGHKWAVPIDLKNCFPSFRVRRAAGMLPLPLRVAENALTLECREIRTRGGDTSNRTKKAWVRSPYSRRFPPSHVLTGSILARQALSQGSAASPVAAEVLLAWLLRALPEGARVVAYVDDILLLARTRNEARATHHALQQALRCHPAGPLRAKPTTVRRVCDGFDFLGWRFRTRHGDLRVKPSQDALQKFRRELRARIEAGEDGWTYARNWTRQFAPWESSDAFIRTAVESIER